MTTFNQLVKDVTAIVSSQLASGLTTDPIILNAATIPLISGDIHLVSNKR